MNKFTPYIVSIVAALGGIGFFLFSGFAWDQRNLGWGALFLLLFLSWGIITWCVFDTYRSNHG